MPENKTWKKNVFNKLWMNLNQHKTDKPRHYMPSKYNFILQHQEDSVSLMKY